MVYPAFLEWVKIASGGENDVNSVDEALGRLTSPGAVDAVRACDEALSKLQQCDSLESRATWSRTVGCPTVKQVADTWQRSSGVDPRVTGAAVVTVWFLAACEDCPDMANHGSSLLRQTPGLMRDVAHTVSVIAGGQLSTHLRVRARERASAQLREHWKKVRTMQPACCASRP